MVVTIDISIESFDLDELPPRGADQPLGFNEADVNFNWNDFAFNEVGG